MPKSNSNWTWSFVKDGNTNVGRISYASSTQGEYQAFKTKAALARGVPRFGSRRKTYTPAQGGGIRKTYVSASLRRRMPRAKRDDLAAIGVLNPAFNPVGGGHKSHLVPDIFGGPSSAHNLINETQRINTSGHKRIENRIGRLIKAVTAANDTSPLAKRGGLVMREDFDQQGRSTERVYMLSVLNRTNRTRTYHKLSFKRL
ncbi:hypothetical protein FHW84_003668 [Dyella sp. SG562]|uniref:DNA/RNA non-specific endonuclease n=1 Tax=Dyella sp. SG562 TaxID=2587017 RepID=UPI00142340BB|nr:DNA/RNA non-specific endonuclease [Dyella sp. SG562]NII75070.1 hypothetical protein [Dyella sp. SG562]